MHRILVVSLNFAPELTGIGKYVGEMTEDLALAGFQVRVVTAPPYYPRWSVFPGYSPWRYTAERHGGTAVYRCPLYVPTAPGGLRRFLHLVSFAVSAAPVILWQAITWRPATIFLVEPPLTCAPMVWVAGRLAGARLWLHVQDFEVDAAFELGILRSRRLRRIAQWIESWLMLRFDQVSTISATMRERLCRKGVPAARTRIFPNWVDLGHIRPLDRGNRLRRELGIPDSTLVLLYSGNMGEKQGLDVLIDAASRLASHDSTLFLLCGDGAARARIQAAAARMSNVRFIPLQPSERLPELLALADIHLLPQRANVEDLVLPSKLTSMMASGRPVIATATPDSEVGRAVAECGIVVPPGDGAALASAICRLLADAVQRQILGEQGRAWAAAHWDRSRILKAAGDQFSALLARN